MSIPTKNTQAPSPADSSEVAETSLNIVAAIGTIADEPDRRDLPSGARLVTFSLTVRVPGVASTSLPVAWFDPPARAPQLDGDDVVLVVGRMARRFFQAGGITQSRTELVAERVEPIRRRATCRKVLRRIEEHLEATAIEVFAPD